MGTTIKYLNDDENDIPEVFSKRKNQSLANKQKEKARSKKIKPQTFSEKWKARIYIDIYVNYRLKISNYLYNYHSSRALALQKYACMENNTEPKDEDTHETKAPTKIESPNGLPNYISNDLCQKLDSWEANLGFLSHEITLQKLSKSLGTNYSYLSKHINASKGVNFSSYVNNLRIEYIKHRFKTNSLYTKYTVKAIAEEIGFKSSECFSKSFYKRYGIYPSQYLKTLRAAD